MNKLQRQIKKVEEDIALQNHCLNQQYFLLMDRVYTPRNLTLAIIGGFAFGYLFARKKNMKQLVTDTLQVSVKVNRFYQHMKVILSFFPI